MYHLIGKQKTSKLRPLSKNLKVGRNSLSSQPKILLKPNLHGCGALRPSSSLNIKPNSTFRGAPTVFLSSAKKNHTLSSPNNELKKGHNINNINNNNYNTLHFTHTKNFFSTTAPQKAFTAQQEKGWLNINIPVCIDGSQIETLKTTGQVDWRALKMQSPNHVQTTLQWNNGSKVETQPFPHMQITSRLPFFKMSSLDGGEKGDSSAPSDTSSGQADEEGEEEEDEFDEDILTQEDAMMLKHTTKDMLPKEVVAELDKHIIGQSDAKKVVANALRNRWRRLQVQDSSLQDEILPKNILMVGPTGVGKTEIARKLALIEDSPFIKVEATKFTEVGFHGKDVDTIIRDLMDSAVKKTRDKLIKKYKQKLKRIVDSKLIDLLTEEDKHSETRKKFKTLLDEGLLENRVVEFDAPAKPTGTPMNFPNQGSQDVLVGTIFERVPPRTQRKKMTISAVRPIIENQEVEKRLNAEMIENAAKEAVEQSGIVFIDEIDKICVRSDSYRSGAEASSEGVQKDLLPLIEGTLISTKYGNIDTSKILFICSGAFHSCKPSDMLAELQGRLPLRVELKGLSQKDFKRILTEPQNNLIRQQVKLLETEDITLKWDDEGIEEIAKLANTFNEQIENIGARRLYTIIEKCVEEISFDCDIHKGKEIVIDAQHVRDKCADMQKKTDLSKFIF